MPSIRSLAVGGLTGLSRGLTRPRADRFVRALLRPDEAQEALLDGLARELAGTAYGRHHGLVVGAPGRPGAAAAAFRERIPVAGYEELAPWIDEQRRTGTAAVCPGSVRFWSRTSGSAGPAKVVPVTAGLREAFGAFFALWLHDLLAHGPRLHVGRAWISVSPRATGASGPDGPDADDRRYVTGWRRALVEAFVAPDPRLARLADPAAFRHVAALTLLATDPEVVSVWNPTLLGILLDHAEEHALALARDWVSGGTEREGLAFRVPYPERGRLRAFLDRSAGWPARLSALRLVSCWTEAGAATGARALAARLPGVVLRDKGLLATEAPISVPWAPAGGMVPLVTDVLFELLAGDGRLLSLAEALDGPDGERYGLVVTPRGGLPRYRLGDRVRVSRSPGGWPLLAFAGREADVADLVGEKLHEAFVAGSLAALALPTGAFRTLVPVREADGRGHYLLLVDRVASSPEALAARLDDLLGQADRYREARRLGQLGPVRVRLRPDAAVSMLHHAAAAAGARLGDVKPRALAAEVASGSPLLA